MIKPKKFCRMKRRSFPAPPHHKYYWSRSNRKPWSSIGPFYYIKYASFSHGAKKR